MTKYSDKLIQETIKSFKEENDLDITAETAQEYLGSLASLYLAFSKVSEHDPCARINPQLNKK